MSQAAAACNSTLQNSNFYPSSDQHMACIPLIHWSAEEEGTPAATMLSQVTHGGELQL